MPRIDDTDETTDDLKRALHSLKIAQASNVKYRADANIKEAMHQVEIAIACQDGGALEVPR